MLLDEDSGFDAEDAADIAAANRALVESDARIPASVVDAILAGEPGVAEAWGLDKK
jgi:hypothetical protein